MPILEEADFDEVRAALGDGFNVSNCPDSKIALDIFQGEAEEEIVQRVGDLEDLTDAQEAHVRKAAIYLTASRLASTYTVIPGYYGTNGDFRDEQYKASFHEARLRRWVEEELAEVSDEDAEPETVASVSTSVITTAIW